MNMTQEQQFHHRTIGPIHEVEPLHEDSDSLRGALEHERDVCDAMRVVIDLSGWDEVGEEEVGVLRERIDPEDERWAIRLAEDIDDTAVQRLSRSGLRARLITQDEDQRPTTVDGQGTDATGRSGVPRINRPRGRSDL